MRDSYFLLLKHFLTSLLRNPNQNQIHGEIDSIPYFIKKGPFKGAGVLQIKLLSARLGPGPLSYGPSLSFKP